MILVDTSVWIDHFRKGNAQLEEHLMNVEVSCHPYIIGELACGNFQSRSQILSLLLALPCVQDVEQAEFMVFLEKNRLMGIGLGFVDIHLLASAVVSDIPLWTLDTALRKAALRLKVCYG